MFSVSFFPPPLSFLFSSLCLSLPSNYPVYVKGKTFPSYSPVTVTSSSHCCVFVLRSLYLFYLSCCTSALLKHTHTHTQCWGQTVNSHVKPELNRTSETHTNVFALKMSAWYCVHTHAFVLWICDTHSAHQYLFYSHKYKQYSLLNTHELKCFALCLLHVHSCAAAPVSK